MTNMKFLGFCAFVIALIMCNEIVSVEGRHLKHVRHHCQKQCSKSSKGKLLGLSQTRPLETKGKLQDGVLNAAAAAGGASSSSYETNVSKADHTEDFRPTAPGHSPGVGHSVHN